MKEPNVDKRTFDAAYQLLMKDLRAESKWDGEDGFEFDQLTVWEIFNKLKAILNDQHQNSEPVSFPLVRDMTARKFKDNMYSAYGFGTP